MPIPQNGVFFLFIMYIDTIIISYRRFPFKTDVPQHTTPPHSNHKMLFNIPAPLTHAKYEKTPRWCLFVLGMFSISTYACQTRKDTSIGVFSCSAPFHIHAHMQNTKRHRFGVFLCSAPVPGCLVSGKRGLPPRLSLFSTMKRPVPSSSIYLLLN